MNRIIFCATVAFVCCGLNSSFGQVSAEGRPVQSPGISPVLHIAFPQDSAISNPFTMAPENATSSEAAPLDLSPQAELSLPDKDPSSLPPTAPDPGRRTVVDTMVDHSTLANVPNASYEPVEWCQGVRTPNPIAEMMLREFCVQGLWDGYEAQRAHACQFMWNHIYGHPECGGCGRHCSSCAHNGCSQCAGHKPINRYRQTCNGNCDTGSCSHSAPINPPTPAATPVVPPVAAPVEAAAAHAAPDYYAKFKAAATR